MNFDGPTLGMFANTALSIILGWLVFKNRTKSETSLNYSQTIENLLDSAAMLHEPLSRDLKAALTNLQTAQQELDEFEGLVEELQKDLKIVIEGAWQLHHQVKSLKGEPVYTPPAIEGEAGEPPEKE